MSDYPLPSHAVSCWVVGDKLFVGVPPNGPGARAHTLTFPATPNGLEVFLTLIRARASDAARSRPMTIGQKSSPVQYDIDGMLLGLRRYDDKNQPVVTPEDLDL